MTELTKLSITEIFNLIPNYHFSDKQEIIDEIIENIDDFNYDENISYEFGSNCVLAVRCDMWGLITVLGYYCHHNNYLIKTKFSEKLGLIQNAYDFYCRKLYYND